MIDDDEYEDPLATARKLIGLITKTIANDNDTKSLALMNSRAELDFQLRLALLELGDDSQPLSQGCGRLPRGVRPLLEVLGDLVTDDSHPKTGDPHQRLQAALEEISCREADSPELSLIQLPQTAKELRALAQKISSFRTASTHHQQLDVNNGDEREVKDGHHDVKKPKFWFSRKGCNSNGLAECQGPATVELRGVTLVAPRMDSYKEKTATDFIDAAQDFYHDKIATIKGKKAIKVAVLDTGLDEGELHFKAVRGSRGTSLKDARSFIGGNTHDTNGHGTKAAGLIVQMAPHVDLYIAKVCHDMEVYGVGQYVEAINWAKNLGDHIINISAAISDNDGIRSAITRAETQGIIIFAAAGNSGANESTAFPAKMDKVLAIHATDGHGNPSTINPSPVDLCANFSTLGESIPSPLEDHAVLEAATSYSTPIAVGMAANILTLVEACFDESDGNPSLRRFAFQREGMKKILLKASHLRSGYRYLYPGRVVAGKDTEDGYREWFTDAMRA